MEFMPAFLLVAVGLVGSLLAFSRWRVALGVAVVMDAVCDPIRKITPDQPMWITHLVLGVWFALLVARFSRSRRLRAAVRRAMPELPKAIALIVLAICVPAVISLVSYRMGWFLVLIGAVSYLAPFAGLYLAIDLGRNSRAVLAFIRLYAGVNLVLLSGNVLEFFNAEFPALGGLGDMVWVRYMPADVGGVIDLVSGFFRSPDVSGFHAAHAAMFCLILAAPSRPSGGIQLHWMVGAVFSLFCLFVTGRRKMFALPVLFLLAVYVISVLRRGGKRSPVGTLYLGIAVLTGIGILGFSAILPGETTEYSEYGVYMESTVYDAAPSLYRKAVQGSWGTILQSGFLGSGLGVATQGNKYAGELTTSETNAWQEDGTSRLFKELGVPGAMLAGGAALCVIALFWRSVRAEIGDPLADHIRVVGLSVFVADSCGFLISHQHLSGSVPNAMLVVCMFGAAAAQCVSAVSRPEGVSLRVVGASR